MANALERIVPRAESRVNTRLDVRYECQRIVRRDTRLSVGARLLYWAIDDFAGKTGGADGRCFPRQATLAGSLGVSLRSVEAWMRELTALGYVRTIRTQRGNRYEAWWANSDPQPVAGGDGFRPAQDCGSDPQPVAGAFNYSYQDPYGDSRPCPRCNGSGERAVTDYRLDGKHRTHRVKCGCQMAI